MLEEHSAVNVKYNGTEFSITRENINDELVELAIKAGMGHCFRKLRYIEEEIDKKKSFVKLSENTILLTSTNEEIEGNHLKKKRRARISKLKNGQPQQPVASTKRKD
jgi:hypothetical protein